MKIKHALILFVSVLLVVAVLASWLFKPKDISVLGLDEGKLLLDSTASCQASPGPCTFQQDNLAISFSLPGPVQPLHPFDMQLHVEGMKPTQVVATFTMQGMDMGLNRFELKQKQGDWHGRALLPICTQARKDWRATISLRTDKGDYRVVFPFTSQ